MIQSWMRLGRVRDAHAAKFNYDLDVIFQDIKEQERKSGLKFVQGVARQPVPNQVRSRLRPPHRFLLTQRRRLWRLGFDMNRELIEMLAPACRGSTAFLAIGNVDRGHDACWRGAGRRDARCGPALRVRRRHGTVADIASGTHLGCETIVFLTRLMSPRSRDRSWSWTRWKLSDVFRRYLPISCRWARWPGSPPTGMRAGYLSSAFSPIRLRSTALVAFTPKGLHLQAQGHAAHPGDSQDDAFTPKGLYPQPRVAMHPGVSHDIFVTPKGLNKGERSHYLTPSG